MRTLSIVGRSYGRPFFVSAVVRSRDALPPKYLRFAVECVTIELQFLNEGDRLC